VKRKGPLDGYKFYFEDVPNYRRCASKLSSLDGLVDRLTYLAHDLVSAIRAIYREVVGK
jgi:hypothetical protein